MQDSQKPMNEKKLSQLMDGDWHELNPSDCIAGVCGDERLRGKWSRYHLIRDALKNESVIADTAMASRICAAIADEPAYSNITTLAASQDKDRVTAHESDSDVEVPERDEYIRGGRKSNLPSSLVEQAVAQDITVGFKLPAREPTRQNPLTPERKVWQAGVTGFALAASMATVTVLGLNVWQGQSVSGADGSAKLAAFSGPAVTAQASGIDTASQAAGAASSRQGVLLADSTASNVFSRQLSGAPLPAVELVANRGAYWVSNSTSERVSNEARLNMFLSQHIENSPTAVREGLLPYSRLVGYDEQLEAR